jgi:hypothetical protein
MTPEGKRRLIMEIKNDMIIKLNLSINLTKKKMDTWEIFPVNEKQTELNFEGEGEAQREQLKEGAYFEVEGLNQGEGEEVPGDQEGEEEDQDEGPIFELITEREDTPAYKKRKAAYKKKEIEAAAN